MKTRIFCLTPAESRALQAAYLHCQNAPTKIRYQAVRLYGNGYAVEQIQDICAASRTSLLEWVQAYCQNGIAALVDHRAGGNRARLRPEQIEALQSQLRTYSPAQLLGKSACQTDSTFWNVPDLACLLEREYGVVYHSRTSYRTLLAKCGFSYQRPAKQYKTHSETKIREFEEQLEKKSWTPPKMLPKP